MPKNSKDSGNQFHILRPMKKIRFWEKGKMAYSALKKINELKAKNELKKAQIILDEWIF